MFRNPTTDLIVVLVIVLLIFGPKRLPGLGRQLGQGIREFKDSITGESGDAAERPELTRASQVPVPPPRASRASAARSRPARPRSRRASLRSAAPSPRNRAATLAKVLRPIGHDDRLSISRSSRRAAHAADHQPGGARGRIRLLLLAEPRAAARAQPRAAAHLDRGRAAGARCGADADGEAAHRAARRARRPTAPWPRRPMPHQPSARRCRRRRNRSPSPPKRCRASRRSRRSRSRSGSASRS